MMLKNSSWPRLLKKAKVQGGKPGTHPQDGCRREAYLPRTSQCRASAPTQQIGLFQQPVSMIQGPDARPEDAGPAAPTHRDAMGTLVQHKAATLGTQPKGWVQAARFRVPTRAPSGLGGCGL